MSLSDLIKKLQAIDAEHDGETLQVFIADHFCYKDCNKQVEGAEYREGVHYAGILADVIII